MEQAPIFFAAKLYDLLGFLPYTRYLVNIEENNSSINYNNTIIVPILEKNQKLLSNCSAKELEEMQEQLAKLHIASALVGHLKILNHHKHKNFHTLFVKNKKIGVVNIEDSFGNGQTSSNYGPVADDFDKLLNPFTCWDGTKLFQKAFKEYTMNNIPSLIDWLDSSFDEAKIQDLFSECGMRDKKILNNLKLRFQNIKNKLQKIEQEGYILVNEEQITNKINEFFNRYPPKDPFVAKNISYEFIDELPIIGEQILLCYDDSEIWLEFVNYEFLINSKESNQLVRMFLGRDKIKTGNVNRKVIEIFEPESIYVFQDAVLQHCDKLMSQGYPKLNIMDAVNVGYKALFYHYQEPSVFEEKAPPNIAKEGEQDPSIKNLLQCIELNHLKYTNIGKNINECENHAESIIKEAKKCLDLSKKDLSRNPIQACVEVFSWPEHLNQKQKNKICKDAYEASVYDVWKLRSAVKNRCQSKIDKYKEGKDLKHAVRRR